VHQIKITLYFVINIIAR